VERQHLVFVYGTLRQGHVNHHLLKDAHCFGMGCTVSNFTLYLISGYPYVSSKENRYTIVGEMYAIDEDTLDKLDKMEGHPRYYVRRETAVIVGGEQYSAWMYFHDPPGMLMPTGDFNDAASVA